MQDDHDRDERLMTTVAAALRLKPEEREAYVDAACGEDRVLRRDVEEALNWEHQMGAFLQQPAFVLEDSARPFEPGQTISGRFDIVSEIGEGAMGIVYEAFDRKRNRQIAIKAAKSAFRRQLSPEVEGALRVRHPNICVVNEIHTASTAHGDVDFLTMELLEGETLAARLAKRGALSAGEAELIARQLCAGLAEAHRSGVVHRDLKPANVILSQAADGSLRAVITDFGVSVWAEPSNDLWGTPRYLAPELWQGHKASPASDLYALGVILFEMIAGPTPSGDSPVTHAAVIKDAQDPYSRLVEGCLSLEPSKRSESFHKALQREYWQKSFWTRRKMISAGIATACAATVAAWVERDEAANLLRPLPRRRFVALLAGPPALDQSAKPLVNGVIDAIESELARAEASDPDLLIVSAHQSSATPDGPNQISGICNSLGANLALVASGVLHPARFTLSLSVIDPKTGTVLRQRKVACETAEIASIAPKAVGTAAKLLNVRWQNKNGDGSGAFTKSARAYRAFQTAEELRSRPNDDGLDQAIETYHAALDADPYYALAYAKLALAYGRLYGLKHNSGSLELASANAAKAIQLDPKLAEGYLARAYVFEKTGNQERALNEIQKALALDPTNQRILLWQAQIYVRFNRWAEAQQAYLQLRKERPNYWIAYNDLGYVFEAQGKYQEAIEAFRAATVAAPASALALNNLGALFFKLGNFAESVDSFQKSLALKPSGLAYSNLAEALRSEGKYDAALAFSKKAVELEPSDDQNWLSLADSYAALPGRQMQAREAYRRAASEVEHALATDPTDGSAWIWLALYRVKNEPGYDVLPLINKAAQFRTSDIDSELAKARVLELTGRRKAALATLADCFGKGTTVFEVSSIRDFEALRKDPAYARIQNVTEAGVTR